MWLFEITFNGKVICVSSRAYNTSRQAEIEAALIIQKMTNQSGSYYSFKVSLGDFDL